MRIPSWPAWAEEVGAILSQSWPGEVVGAVAVQMSCLAAEEGGG